MLLVMVATQAVAENEFEAYRAKQQANTEFDDYKKTVNQEFSDYKTALEAGFNDFQKTYEQASKQYNQEMTQKWGSSKSSDKKSWVNYEKNGDVRESVDFSTGIVVVEVLANKGDSLATIQAKAQENISKLLLTTEKQAFNNDVVAQKVEEQIKQHKEVVKTGEPSTTTKVMQGLVGNISEPEATQQAANFVSKAKVETTELKDKEKKVVKLTFKIPDNLSAKAAQYSQRIQQIAKKEKIPVALMYAVMETESNFNPRAKSHVPAYGLMQIVPVSAGKDATKYLFGKEKVLAPSYLYNSDKNIEIGGAYLHILYHRYLRKIDDTTSRLFCTIAAYNTGAGNVAKTFIGTYNINKAAKTINTFSASDVYKTLRRQLPHDETRQYIKRVATRLAKYQS